MSYFHAFFRCSSILQIFIAFFRFCTWMCAWVCILFQRSVIYIVCTRIFGVSNQPIRQRWQCKCRDITFDRSQILRRWQSIDVNDRNCHQIVIESDIGHIIAYHILLMTSIAIAEKRAIFRQEFWLVLRTKYLSIYIKLLQIKKCHRSVGLSL